MSEIQPFFSVIIPTYNRERVILEAINSVRNQTFKNFELIVVDDGSSDNTEKIVKEISGSDERVRYVHQKNAERSAARNHGIELAIGEYICFLDSDDLYLEDHLFKFRSKLESLQEPAAVLYSNFSTQSKSGLVTEELPNADEANLVVLIMKGSITSQQVCIHRSIVKRFKFNPRIRIGEDRELWFRISEDYPFIFSDQNTVVIRDTGDRSIDPANIWAYEENLQQINHLKKIDNRSRIPKIIMNNMHSTALYKLALCYFGIENRFKALLFLARATFVKPSHRYKNKIILLLSIMGLRFLLPEHLRDAY